jgi:hypothetical protein
MSSMSLHELQQAFSDTLFDPDDRQILPCVSGQSDAAKNSRLDIYRNNVFHSLSDALADLYPVIKRLVGDQFFNATAREYIRQRPPSSAAMVHFGGDFPDFLQGFEHTMTLAYLADVAQVELARHHAYHARDAVALSATDFSAASAEQISQEQLVLHPSVTLLESHYPVFQIWSSNQDEQPNDELIDLDSGGVKLAVYRPRYDVYVREIDGATYALLAALQQGASLESALRGAAELNSTSTIPETFAFCIQEGFFTKIIGS